MCRKLIFVILTLLSVGAAAQHPFSLDWRVLKTPNAKFIYPSYLGYDAARLANSIDRVMSADTANVGVKPRRFPILQDGALYTPDGRHQFGFGGVVSNTVDSRIQAHCAVQYV